MVRVSPKLALIEAGQPYHLLARNFAHRWWRPLPALVLMAAASLVALVTAMAVLALVTLFPPRLIPVGVSLYRSHPELIDRVLADPMWMLFAGFATLIALVPAVLCTVRWVQKRPLGSVTSVVGAMRVRWLGTCASYAFLVFGAAFAVTVVYQVIFGGPPGGPGFPGWPDYARIVLIALLIVPLQSAAEEYVFRGFLLQTLTAWFRTPWVAMVVSSLLFLAGHGYNDPLVWCELLLMGMAMSWLTIRTGGLEASIGMHVANNSLSLIVAGTSGVPGLEQAGDFAIMDVLPFLAAILVYTWLVDRAAARREIGNVIGGRARISPWTLQAAR